MGHRRLVGLSGCCYQEAKSVVLLIVGGASRFLLSARLARQMDWRASKMRDGKWEVV